MGGQVVGIGRIVQVIDPADRNVWLPAIVTEAPEPGDAERRVALVMFGLSDLNPALRLRSVPEQTSEPPAWLCWRWPPRL